MNQIWIGVMATISAEFVITIALAIVFYRYSKRGK